MTSSERDRAELSFKELIELVPAALYVAGPGPGGPWHYVSPQIESLLGFSPAEWIEDAGLWWRRMHRGDRDRVLELEERHLRFAATGSTWVVEYRMAHRNGREVWIRDEARLIFEGSDPPRWRGVLSDVTAQRQELEQTERELAAARLRVTSLLAGIEDHLGTVDETLRGAA